MISRKFWFRARKKLFRSRKLLFSVGVLLLLLSLFKFLSLYLHDDSESGSGGQHQIVLPRELNFAGERVPVTIPGVHETLLKELKESTHWQFRSFVLHQRAHLWFPVIEPILKKNGIPDDFKFLAVAESYLTQSVSPRGAAGFWQILSGTAERYGLEVNEEVDERYHVQKSTVAACRYFNEAFRIFGSWTLTAASYNLGINGIETELKKQQVKNYFQLNLNRETSRYMYRVLALKEILSNPKRYGYMLGKKDLYPPVQTVSVIVDSTITDLSRFARQQGSNLETLRYFNPWLRSAFLNNIKGKSYRIFFPRNKKYMVLPEADSIPIAGMDSGVVPVKIFPEDSRDSAPSAPVSTKPINP